MKIQRKIEVSKTSEFTAMETGCKFDCKLLTSVDYGKTFWYCGYGRFCKTEEEVINYIKDNTDKFTLHPGFMKNVSSFVTDVFQFPHDMKCN